MNKPIIDFDEKFILEVRKRPLLYNPSVEGYNSLRKKEQAWQIISRRVNLNLTMCRKRWRGLRDCYKRCKRLDEAGARQKWKYFQPMSFLDNIPSSRRSIWNIPQEYTRDEKLAQHKSADQVEENESIMQTVEDEITVKAPDEYFENNAGDALEFIAREDALPNIESTLLIKMENKDISFEEKLIEEVRQQTCLYDSCSQDYLNNMVKNRVWVGIASRLNSNDDVCRKLWKTLRDTYKKTLERVKLRSGTAGRKRHWKYFENMKFLDDYAESRCIIGTMETINKTEDTDFDIEVPEEKTLNSDDLETPARFAHSPDPLEHSTSSECSTASCRKQKSDSFQSKQTDSTTLLFESLNRNIKDAQLSAKQRLDIESSIAALVYAKLLNYNN